MNYRYSLNYFCFVIEKYGTFKAHTNTCTNTQIHTYTHTHKMHTKSNLSTILDMSLNFHVSLTAVLWWCMPEDTLSWNSHVQLMRGISSECWTPSAHCVIILWCQHYHVAMPTLSYCDASTVILWCQHYHVVMPTLWYFLCRQHYHIVMPALSCCVANMMMLWCYIKGSKERCLLGQNTYKVLG